MGRLLILVAGLIGAGNALAQVSVYSAQADAVSVTIYREGIALITETRRVELPATPVTLVFQGVVETLLPRSAVMDGAGRALVEADFRFDRLTPASLLQRSVGQVVTIVQTSTSTGKATRLEARVESAERGVVLRSVEGNEALYCSGQPQSLEFSRIPDGLAPTPTLSVRLAGGTAGIRTITVSYLASGFSWSADYVAQLNDKSDRMDLRGWITLRNETGSSFSQARVQLVAGRLNLQPDRDGGSRPASTSLREQDEKTSASQLALLHGCYPLAKTTDGLPQVPVYPNPFPYLSSSNSADVVDLNIIPSDLLSRMDVVTGAASATYGSGAVAGVVNLVLRQNLGDYQLYRLPWPTDLNAQQTKQVAFLDKKAVKVERFYSIRVPGFEANNTVPSDAPSVTLRWQNKRSAGLGEPLPAGLVRVFEPQSAGMVFAGEARLGDLPVGLPAEIGIARAMDLGAESMFDDVDGYDENGRTIVRIKAAHLFINQKGVPVRMEVRHLEGSGYGKPDIVHSNLRARLDKGGLLWRFEVPAGGTKSLRYELKARQRND